MENHIEQAMDILTEISEDRTVPKNIREKCKTIKEIFISSDEIRVKISKAIQIIDEISEDPNVAPYTRTQIWGIASLLESIEHE